MTPRKTKFRKMQRGRSRGKSKRGSKLVFGVFGLKAEGRGLISGRQIEAARRAITRHIKRGGEVWIRIFPDKPITKKPPESRMGKGKGSVEHYAAEVLPGRIIFEIDGLPERVMKKALTLAAYKLGVKTRIVSKE